MHKARIILIAMVALIVGATLVVMEPAARDRMDAAPAMAATHHCDACPEPAEGVAEMAHAGGCSSGAGCLVLSLPQARALPRRVMTLAALDPPEPVSRHAATAPSLDLPPPRA